MRRSSKIVDEVFFALCKNVDSGISLSAWLRYKYSQRELLELEVRPEWYNTAYSFAKDYAVSEYLSKSDFLKTGIDTSAAALQRFNTAEAKCKETNNRLRSWSGATPALHSRIFRMQRKISDILGPLELPRVLELCRWGPGATADLSRVECQVDIKQSKVPSITTSAKPYGRALLESDPHWFGAITGIIPEGRYSVLDTAFDVIEWNRVVMVPKNAKTKRTIAAEPTLNGYIQQGVGRYIRRRLKRFGVDLNNQEINQAWASLARDLDLATLDLKAASDTIARVLVYQLLPLDWYLFMDSIRSKDYKFNGKRHVYEKFSSMGNAFTFELESLIFHALLEVCEEEAWEGLIPHSVPICSVYGDDLICTKMAVPLVLETLAYCGFELNLDKSHMGGQFFESCGEHYYGQTKVTPAYQKVLPTSGPEQIRLGNRLIRLAHRLGGGDYLDSVVRSAYRAARRGSDGRLSKYVIPFGSEDDDGWATPSGEWPGANYTPGLGWHCRVIRPRRRFRPRIELSSFAHSLAMSSLKREPLSYIKWPTPIAVKAFAAEGLVVSSGVADGLTELEPRGWKAARRRVIATRDFDVTWI